MLRYYLGPSVVPTNSCKIVVDDPNQLPFAVVEFGIDGTIFFANRLFQQWFFAQQDIDLARAAASPQAVTCALLRLQSGEPVDQLEKTELGAEDYFYCWTAIQTEDEAEVILQYPRTIPLDQHYQMPPHRSFNAHLSSRLDKSTKKEIFTALIFQTTKQRRERAIVSGAAKALQTSLTEKMVERMPDGSTPGLAYTVKPQFREVGVGGDFLFDSSVTSAKVVKPKSKDKKREPLRLRVTMVGDAAETSLIGASMARDVGRILRSICVDGKFTYLQYAGADFAIRIAKSLNAHICKENETASSGVDGMIFVTDFMTDQLHMVPGKFEAYIFLRDTKSLDEIKQVGKMFSGDPAASKTFGLRLEQKFDQFSEKITRDSVVVTYSDGFREFFTESNMKTELLGVIERLDPVGDDYEERLLLELEEICQPLRERRLRKEKDRNSGQSVINWDDEIICAFSPLRRPWNQQ